MPHILLVNPWIHDFAAYDFWARPLGLLILAGILRSHGFATSYIDCLDRFHPKGKKTTVGARFGRGSYHKTPIPTPDCISDVKRTFSRYGVLPAWFREDLESTRTPDLILVTSIMTYWYPGITETVAHIRTIFPNVPIILGGIYATLCADHARKHTGADEIVSGPGEANILSLAQRYTRVSIKPEFDPDDLDTYPYPALNLQRKIPFVPLLTSKGCPFSCAYCASGYLFTGRKVRSPDRVVTEIEYWHRRQGVQDFVFYDDALLVDPETHAMHLFEKIIATGLPVRFHTPNALHIRGISNETAKLMYHAGFQTLRLGLETANFQDRTHLDGKVTETEFRRAVSCLHDAGFKKEQIGAYLLAGLPDQPLAAVERSIRIVKESGITPILAHYTPIPHTRMWPRAVSASRYDLNSDPIFSNNAISPCNPDGFSWQILSHLKNQVSGDNQGRFFP